MQLPDSSAASPKQTHRRLCSRLLLFVCLLGMSVWFVSQVTTRQRLKTVLVISHTMTSVKTNMSTEGRRYLSHWLGIETPPTLELLGACADKFSVPVILFDPPLLSSLARYSVPREDNFSVPDTSPILTAAILEADLQPNGDQISDMLVDLQSSGFRLITVTERDSRFQAQSAPIARIITQYILYSSNQTIQILILYRRANSYYWSAGFSARTVQRMPPAASNNSWIFDVPRAFDLFDLVKLEVRGGSSLYAPSNLRAFLWQLPASKFLECAQKRVDNFYKNNNESQNKGFNKRIQKSVIHVKQKLRALEKRFWIFSGTLLGWYRQCNVIPHTSDVDFGAWVSNYGPEMDAAFRNNKIVRLGRKFGWVNDSLEFQMWGYGVHIDIFFIYGNKTSTWLGAMRVGNKSKVIMTYYHFTICSGELLGVLLNVPCEAGALVEQEYGADWATPKKNWHWSSSPLNLRENGRWTDEQWKTAYNNYD